MVLHGTLEDRIITHAIAVVLAANEIRQYNYRKIHCEFAAPGEAPEGGGIPPCYMDEKDDKSVWCFSCTHRDKIRTLQQEAKQKQRNAMKRLTRAVGDWIKADVR